MQEWSNYGPGAIGGPLSFLIQPIEVEEILSTTILSYFFLYWKIHNRFLQIIINCGSYNTHILL